MLAAIGCGTVEVTRHPRLAVFTTGDEVMPLGTALRSGQIFNSNGPMLHALVQAAGFGVSATDHLPDYLERTVEVLREAASQHDVIVCSGGVSVGDHDYVRAALERLGTVRFWRVAMKPGKPLVYGRIGDCAFFGLPGNPVSSLVSFELFVRPALRKLAGHTRLDRPRVRARLLSPLQHRPGREEYARVTTTRSGDDYVSDPHPGQASHMLSSLVASNSLAVIPAEAGSMPAGARVDVLMMEWPEE